jgi:tellurite methyltransferase
MDKNDWEIRFQALAAAGAEGTTRQPDPLVEQIAGHWRALWPAPKTRRALDLACGAGAHALWLAEKGWDVTAVDQSPSTIDLVRAEASRRGIHVTTQVADLEAHEFEIAPGGWDLILMCRYLQRDLFEPAKLGLAPGGMLIVIALLAEHSLAEHRKEKFRVQPGELASCFGGSSGWAIIHQREGKTREHRVAEIVIRRDG